MEHYSKGKCIEEALERNKIPINSIPENFLWMQVKGGSKMINLLSHASGIFEDKSATAVVWSAVGIGIPKALSCAEIFKRKFSIQHQVTKLVYKSVEEFWEPKIDGLETIVVKRQVPVIHILLSSEDLSDMEQLGYQNALKKPFWQKDNSTLRRNQPYKPKKTPKYKTPQTPS